MKRAACMFALMLFPRLLAAQPVDVTPLLGKNWYGLYLNGQKAGFAVHEIARDPQGRVSVSEEASFRIMMAGVRQDMHIHTRRVYDAEGVLLSVESKVTDPSKTASEFSAVADDDGLAMKSVINGDVTEVRLPKPSESLADAVKHAQWVTSDPHPGDTLSFTVFEPMFQREIGGTSEILEVEQRVFEGVRTRVYKIKTALDIMDVESVSYVAEDGTTLEDVTSQIITMRLEPEQIAKDVSYSNDVIVSNAAMLDEPLDAPRTRATLKLRLDGPLSEDHLFNNERQKLRAENGHFVFESKIVSLDGLTPAQLPIEDEELKRWTQPTVFIQSNDSRLVEKARSIAGDERDTLAISNKLCAWVNQNMRSTFSARLTNALEVLDNLEGDCTEHSILFIGLCRALGLPAREVAGLVYVEGKQPGFYFHQWAMVWVGKWIDVDPTFNQPLADTTHIKLAEGDLLTQSKIIPIIGTLKVSVIDDAAQTAAAGTDAAP